MDGSSSTPSAAKKARRSRAGSWSSVGEDDPLDRDWLSESLLAKNMAVTNQANEAGLQATNLEHGGLSFTVVTWNLWFSNFKWEDRLVAALVETLQHDPDVFCFQEVRTEVHSCMMRCHFLRERYEPTEERLPCSYDCAVWVKRGESRLVRWTCSTIPLQSIFGRRGVCVDLHLGTHISQEREPSKDQIVRVRVVTSHLESGKELAATRRKQLQTLFSMLQESQSRDPVDAAFLVGDFNLDVGYPENELVDSNGQDLWKLLRPNDAGYTENTYRNKMRYIAHGKHKQVRYDRIVWVDPTAGVHYSCKPESMELLGTVLLDSTTGEVLVSDHFGLVARVKFRRQTKNSDEAATDTQTADQEAS